MTAERAQAYRRVTRMLEEIGPTKLLPAEQERVRAAADALVFAEDLAVDPDALDALEDVELLGDALVDSGRWERVTANRLVDDVAACGPSLVAAVRAA